MQNKIQPLAKRLIDNVMPSNLKRHRKEAARIENYYHPRNVFARWRDSDEGKAWKQKQFAAIVGKCPFPKCSHVSTDISSFVIDHIKPLSKHPELAVTLKNLRLLCHSCNLRKGSG